MLRPSSPISTKVIVMALQSQIGGLWEPDPDTEYPDTWRSRVAISSVAIGSDLDGLRVESGLGHVRIPAGAKFVRALYAPILVTAGNKIGARIYGADDEFVRHVNLSYASGVTGYPAFCADAASIRFFVTTAVDPAGATLGMEIAGMTLEFFV